MVSQANVRVQYCTCSKMIGGQKERAWKGEDAEKQQTRMVTPLLVLARDVGMNNSYQQQLL